MTQLLKATFSFSLILAWTINSQDTIIQPSAAQTPISQLSFTQNVSTNLKNKVQIFKKNWQTVKKVSRVPLKMLFTAAPTLAFAHYVPVLTAGWALCAGMAGGLVGSALNQKVIL